MSPTVDALLPLSLLEAVRNVDTPDGELEAEFVPELRNKRLGLSDTVYAQIRRYTDAVRRSQRAATDEAIALAKLIGRRPDAEAVFRSAGRYLADEAYRTIPALVRQLMRVLPSIAARPLAFRYARRISQRYFNGSVSRLGGSVMLEVPQSITIDTGPRSVGCAYYEAGLRELLHLLANGGGSVEHVSCQSRGEGHCTWRADWRPIAVARA